MGKQMKEVVNLFDLLLTRLDLVCWFQITLSVSCWFAKKIDRKSVV